MISVNKTTNDYSKDSKLYKNVDKSLEQINSLINDLKPAVEKISRNPNSIILDLIMKILKLRLQNNEKFSDSIF